MLLNIGSILELSSDDWFGSFESHVVIHIIDSSRPQRLSNIFGQGRNADRIITWDDGTIEKLTLERHAHVRFLVSLEGFADSSSTQQYSSTTATKIEALEVTWERAQSPWKRVRTARAPAVMMSVHDRDEGSTSPG